VHMAVVQRQGRRLDFISCLGAGGFGEVYLAELVTSSGLQRRVAVKTLHSKLSLRTSAVRRLRDEARLLAALNHRAILQVIDLVDVDGRLGLITEYVEGQDLATVVSDGDPLPVRVALEIICELAGALDAALRTPSPQTGQPLALVHRDVKPANVRLTKTGGVKLLDFGIARSEAVVREAHTGTGLVVGSMGYLAPECLTETGVFAETDIFALGCVLFEELAGRRLYAGVDKRRLAHLAIDERQHESFVQEHVASLPLRVPDEVRKLLLLLLAYEPQDRPSADRVERRCDELASRLDGPHLRRWARDRVWPEPATVHGDLVGARISVSGLVDKISTGSGTALGVLDPETEETVPGRDPNPTLIGLDRSLGDAGESAHGETMDFVVGPGSDVAPLPSDVAAAGAPVRRGRGGLWLGAGIGVLAVVGIGLWVGLVPRAGGHAAALPAVVDPPTAAEGTGPATPTSAAAGAQPADSVAAETPAAAAPPDDGPDLDAGAGTGSEGATADDDPTPSADRGDAAGGDAAPAQAGSTTARSSTGPATRSARATAAQEVSAPPPEATPPAAAALPTGHVTVNSSVPVVLDGVGGRHAAGDLPAGHYAVLADFGDGMKRYGTLDLTEGATRTVTCSRFVLNCEVE